MDVQKIIFNKIKDYWKEHGFACDVIVYFKCKYSFEEKYNIYGELFMCDSDTDFDLGCWNTDWCEGQDVIDENSIKIVDLETVIDEYYTRV